MHRVGVWGIMILAALVAGLSAFAYRDRPVPVQTDQRAEGAGAVIFLTEADNGRTLELKAGDVFSIALPENASTGYVWELLPSDPALVHLAGKTSMYPDTAVGSGGQVTFLIRAEKAGQGKVAFALRRPWEDAAASSTMTIGVNVAP